MARVAAAADEQAVTTNSINKDSAASPRVISQRACLKLNTIVVVWLFMANSFRLFEHNEKVLTPCDGGVRVW